MAKKSIYLPYYENGAFSWIELEGMVDLKGAPEGAPAIKASAAATVPPLRLQPHPRHKAGQE